MKNLVVVALLSAILGYLIGQDLDFKNKETTHEDIKLSCSTDVFSIKSTFTGWINSGLKAKSNSGKVHPIQIVDVSKGLHYKTIPELLNRPLYEDFENSVVCQSQITVNFTPESKEEHLETIDVRFQKVITDPDEMGSRSSYTSMSGVDVEDMNEQIWKFYKKHNPAK